MKNFINHKYTLIAIFFISTLTLVYVVNSNMSHSNNAINVDIEREVKKDTLLEAGNYEINHNAKYTSSNGLNSGLTIIKKNKAPEVSSEKKEVPADVSKDTNTAVDTNSSDVRKRKKKSFGDYIKIVE